MSGSQRVFNHELLSSLQESRRATACNTLTGLLIGDTKGELLQYGLEWRSIRVMEY